MNDGMTESEIRRGAMERMRLIMPLSRLSEQERAALQTYVTALLERFGPQLADVLLFGSKARGEAVPGSDIDVVVILDQPNARDLGDARGLGFDTWLTHQMYLSIRAVSMAVPLSDRGATPLTPTCSCLTMNVKVEAFILQRNILDLPVVPAPVKHVYGRTRPIWDRVLTDKGIHPDAFLAIDNNAHVLALVLLKVFQDVGSVLCLVGSQRGVLPYRSKESPDACLSAGDIVDGWLPV